MSSARMQEQANIMRMTRKAMAKNMRGILLSS
jgi:hypothetical protein